MTDEERCSEQRCSSSHVVLTPTVCLLVHVISLSQVFGEYPA